MPDRPGQDNGARSISSLEELQHDTNRYLVCAGYSEKLPVPDESESLSQLRPY
jgi:hypothetical protein